MSDEVTNIVLHHDKSEISKKTRLSPNLNLSQLRERTFNLFSNDAVLARCFVGRNRKNYLCYNLKIVTQGVEETGNTNNYTSIVYNDNDFVNFLKNINLTVNINTIIIANWFFNENEYFATEFGEELITSVRLCAAVYNANENEKDNYGLKINLNTTNYYLEFFGNETEKIDKFVIRSDCWLEDTKSFRFIVATSGTKVYICIRGTVNTNNWLSNTDCTSDVFDENHVGVVHRGFHNLSKLLDHNVIYDLLKVNLII